MSQSVAIIGLQVRTCASTRRRAVRTHPTHDRGGTEVEEIIDKLFAALASY